MEILVLSDELLLRLFDELVEPNFVFFAEPSIDVRIWPSILLSEDL